MTETVPIFRPHIEAAKETGTLPALLRRDIGMGTADDAAGIITFLASDEAAAITGQAFAIGGDRVACGLTPSSTASVITTMVGPPKIWSANGPCCPSTSNRWAKSSPPN